MSEQQGIKRQERLLALLHEVQNGYKTPDVVMEELSRYLKPIPVEEVTPGYTPKKLWDIFSDSKKPEEYIKTIQLPWVRLNGYMGGLKGGRLIIFGGSTGHGKSMFSVNMAVHAASHGEKVDFFSFEMTGREVMYRVYSHLAEMEELDLSGISTYLTEEERHKIQAAQETMQLLDITIDDSCEESLDRLIDKMEESTADLIIIDHIHNVEGKHENRVLDLSNIARKLKKIAMTKRVPVVAMAQLKDRPHSVRHLMPTIDDLAWSSDIKKHADQVVLLYDRNQEDDQIEVKLGKNRSGVRSGNILLKFIPSHCRILDWPADQQQPTA